MTLFLISFFLIYGAMHVYALSKAKAVLPLSALQLTLLIAWMLMMIIAPFVIRYSEKVGLELTARVMSYIGYVWMGALFLFISISLVIDILKSIIYLADKFLKKNLIAVVPAERGLFFFTVTAILLICVYGYYEAANIRTEKITIKTPKLEGRADRLRIAQISDVHLGLIVREKRLRKIVDMVIDSKPDIFVSTGDLVDGQINGLNGLSELLKEVNTKYGKYAITGNHEFYAGLDQALNFTEKAGFTLLRGKSANIEDIINIAGIDDRTADYYGLYKDGDEAKMLASLDHSLFTLFLKHRPVINPASEGLFDLQLSGHTHRGQIFPFRLVTAMFFTHNSGLLTVKNKYSLYVSRGTGTWGPPIRFLSPPEVTIIDIVPEKPGQV